jgi:hypothetical protein
MYKCNTNVSGNKTAHQATKQHTYKSIRQQNNTPGNKTIHVQMQYKCIRQQNNTPGNKTTRTNAIQMHQVTKQHRTNAITGRYPRGENERTRQTKQASVEERLKRSKRLKLTAWPFV